MNKHIIRTALASAVVMMVLMACEKDFDTPPPRSIPEGFRITIADLKQVYADSGEYTFTEDYSMFVTVTSNDVNGAYGKNGFVQDSTGAMVLRTVAYSALKEGDYIRVALNGLTISEYSGMPQIDDLDTETNVFIQANNQFIEPLLVTIDQINPSIQGMLIRMDSVEFKDDEIGQPFADSEGGNSVDHYIQDCSGNSVIVRTSGYADFADTAVPGKRGTITAVVGQFGSTMQLVFSTLADLELTALRCDGSSGDVVFVKNFEDESVTSGGWSQELVIGDSEWGTASFGGNVWGKISNYDGSNNNPSDAWLISPAIDLTSVNSPALSFLTTTNYNGPALQAYISTNYNTSGGVQAATWTELSAALSPSNGGWQDTPSGLIDIAAFATDNTRIAFRYTGSGSDGATWEIDNITVFGQ
jgi:hypothetical protein